MPMKREQQWDMFDVATGACGLDDYLFQRYSENDLMSKFWVEKTDQVDELRKPPEGSPSKEQVIIPIQGPRAGTPVAAPAPVATEPLPTRPPWEAPGASQALPSRPPWEAAPASAPAAQVPAPQPAYTPPPAPQVRPPQPSEPAVQAPSAPSAPAPTRPPAPTPAATSPPPAPEAPRPPSMEELLARFHQATAAYQERAKDDLPEETPAPDEEA